MKRGVTFVKGSIHAHYMNLSLYNAFKTWTVEASSCLDKDQIDRLMEAVPIYQLSCNMEPEAAKVAYEGIKGYKFAEQRG